MPWRTSLGCKSKAALSPASQAKELGLGPEAPLKEHVHRSMRWKVAPESRAVAAPGGKKQAFPNRDSRIAGASTSPSDAACRRNLVRPEEPLLVQVLRGAGMKKTWGPN